MVNNLVVGSKIKVKLRDEMHSATIRRIGSTDSSWCMLTLDINGEVGYAVARVDELHRDATSI